MEQKLVAVVLVDKSILPQIQVLLGLQEKVTELGRRASSADGTKLAVAVNNGQIYTSTDSGVTWTPRENNRIGVHLLLQQMANF